MSILIARPNKKSKNTTNLNVEIFTQDLKDSTSIISSSFDAEQIIFDSSYFHLRKDNNGNVFVTVNVVDFEIPSGTKDGFNTTFSLSNSPYPTSSLKVYKNGLVMMHNDDYFISGNIINFNTGSIPKEDNNLFVYYRYI